MNEKDARVKIMNETLQGMRLIKFFAWEASFQNKIAEIRERELVALKRSSYLRAVLTFLWMSTPLLVSMVTFIVFTVAGGVLTPEKAFTALGMSSLSLSRTSCASLTRECSSLQYSSIPAQHAPVRDFWYGRGQCLVEASRCTIALQYALLSPLSPSLTDAICEQGYLLADELDVNAIRRGPASTALRTSAPALPQHLIMV